MAVCWRRYSSGWKAGAALGKQGEIIIDTISAQQVS